MATRYPRWASVSAWKRRGRGDITFTGGAGGTGKITKTERDALVWGSYIPSTANRGLLPGWTPNTLTPGPAPDINGDIFLTTAGATYTNTIFYGRVWFKATGIVVDNSQFCGWHPSNYCDLDVNGNIIAGSQVAGDVAGCIANAGATVYQATITDSLIDPTPWGDPTVTTRPGGAAAVSQADLIRYLAFSAGVRGGKVTMNRVEIRNVQDAFSFHQPRATTGDTAFTRINYGLHHQGHYYAGADFTMTPDGTHTDGLQTQTGRDFQMYRTRVSGFHNAGATLKQEVNADVLNRIEDFIIEESIIEDDGSDGGALINHVYMSTRPDSWGGTTAIRNNLMVQRQAGGLVINRHTSFAAKYTNNRLVTLNANGSGWTDLGLAPITNG